MITLQEKNFPDFFATPFQCYESNSPFVSVFKDDLKRFLKPTNPLFRDFGRFTFFTAYKNGKLAGRIVAHLHQPSNEIHKLKRSYFGYFDCANDPEIARTLLQAAEKWGRAQGCDEIAGNFNLTAMQQIGVVTDLFDHQPYTDQVWSPPHIANFLRDNGYEAFFPMTTFEVDVQKFDPETLLTDRIQGALKKYEFRSIEGSVFKQMMHDTCDVLNDGFLHNPMFVPLTHEEFWFQAKDMMLVIDKRLPQMAYLDGRPVGSLVCIPDLNPFLRKTRSRLQLSTPFHFLGFKRRRERAVIIFCSVAREHHSFGVNGAMMYRALSNMKAAGYKTLGLTWIADINKASLRQAEKLSGKPLHRLHLFRKGL